MMTAPADRMVTSVDVAATFTRSAVPLDRRRSGRWLGLVIASLLVAASIGTTWHGMLRQPTGPATGSLFVARPVVEPARLRVATFNVHSCRNGDGQTDIVRTAAALAGFDFVGLNEVRSAADGPGPGPSQAHLLADHLDMHALFNPTERRWWRDDFGNGVVTRVPIERWTRVQLPTESSSHRNVVLSRVRVGGEVVQILTTHVDRVEGRAAQLAMVTELFLSVQPPAILMGDLNTNARDPLIQPLLTAGDVRSALSGLNDSDDRRIDWILTRAMRTIDAGMIDNGASDHPLLWAELEPVTMTTTAAAVAR
jgi:endonuclease/exonuclease/phosphatase family metal-dependent hydrolase